MVPAQGQLQPPAVSDAAIRAALVQQSGTLKAAERTAKATQEAAETAAKNAWWAAILALTGAIFTAFVSWRNGWLQTRTTQQIKHADFRQGWIDKLREEIARFTRLATENDGESEAEGKLKESMSIIILRMDKDDPDYDQLISLMDEVADRSRQADRSANAASIADFLQLSQAILKREWEVTKRDMHATPWGRPFSWIAARARRRRREEEKEMVRRTRTKESATPPKRLFSFFGWPIVWRRRQRPPADPKKPLIRIGRLQLMRAGKEEVGTTGDADAPTSQQTPPAPADPQ